MRARREGERETEMAGEYYFIIAVYLGHEASCSITLLSITFESHGGAVIIARFLF